MKCAIGLCGHCQFGGSFVCKDGPVFPTTEVRPLLGLRGDLMTCRPRQTQARRLEVRLLRRLPALPARLRGRAAGRRRRGRDRLLPRGDAGARSQGPTTCRWSRARSPPPHDAERIQRGAPAVEGARHDRRLRHRRRHPGAAQLRRRRGSSPPSSTPGPSTSPRSRRRRPIAAHVPVDFELRGCPINKRQLLEVMTAFLARRKPVTPPHSVCVECKLRGNVCVMVAHGTPCLGPVTHAGCGALCPAYDRGCYGCFGPMEPPNAPSLSALAGPPRHERAATSSGVYRTFNAERRAVPGRGRTSWPVERSRSTISPASKAKARSPSTIRDGEVTERGSSASSSRRASSRRSCAAAPSPRRPTSPRASAASARSPTR